MKIGIRIGALFRAFLATRIAFSGSDGLGPHDLTHIAFLAIWSETAATGRSSVARRGSRDPAAARQSGNPAPTGRPAARMARRSGGNAKPKSASVRANSASERPGWTGMPELRRWVMTLLARDENENRPLRSVEAVAVAVETEAARAERRRRPAM